MRTSSTEAGRFIAAAHDLPLVIDQAANAIDLLARIMREQDHDGHFGLADMAALASRALNAAHEAHNEAMVDLARYLQDQQPKGGK